MRSLYMQNYACMYQVLHDHELQKLKFLKQELKVLKYFIYGSLAMCEGSIKIYINYAMIQEQGLLS